MQYPSHGCLRHTEIHMFSAHPELLHVVCAHYSSVSPGTLCLLLHLHSSQRFAFWSMNGVSRNWLLCWYASERIMLSSSLLFIVYQRCLISDKQKRWILGNLAIIKSRMSRMALQYVQCCV